LNGDPDCTTTEWLRLPTPTFQFFLNILFILYFPQGTLSTPGEKGDRGEPGLPGYSVCYLLIISYDFNNVIKNKKAKQLFKIYSKNNHNILLKYLEKNMLSHKEININ